MREVQAIVLRTVQIHGGVYIKELPIHLAENPISVSVINPYRELRYLEQLGLLRSTRTRRKEKPRKKIRVYRITRKGQRELLAFQERLKKLTKFLKTN